VVEETLPNGLRVLALRRPSAPTAAFVIRFAVGSAHEGRGETGMAHLLEHLLFKGTTTVGTRSLRRERELFPAMDAVADSLLAARATGAGAAEEARLRRRIRALEDRARSYVEPAELDRILTEAGARTLNATTSAGRHPVLRPAAGEPGGAVVRAGGGPTGEPGVPGVLRGAGRGGGGASPADRDQPGRPAGGGVLRRRVPGAPVRGAGDRATCRTSSRTRGPRGTSSTAATTGRGTPWSPWWATSIPTRSWPGRASISGPSPRAMCRCRCPRSSRPSAGSGVWRWCSTRRQRSWWAGTCPPAPTPSPGRGRARPGAGGRAQLPAVPSPRHRRSAGDGRVVEPRPGLPLPPHADPGGPPLSGRTPDEVLEAAMLDEEVGRLAREPPTMHEIQRVRNQMEAGEVVRLGSNLGLAFQLAESVGLHGDWRETFRHAGRLASVTPEDVQAAARRFLRAGEPDRGRPGPSAGRWGPGPERPGRRRGGPMISARAGLPVRAARTALGRSRPWRSSPSWGAPASGDGAPAGLSRAPAGHHRGADAVRRLSYPTAAVPATRAGAVPAVQRRDRPVPARLDAAPVRRVRGPPRRVQLLRPRGLRRRLGAPHPHAPRRHRVADARRLDALLEFHALGLNTYTDGGPDGARGARAEAAPGPGAGRCGASPAPPPLRPGGHRAVAGPGAGRGAPPGRLPRLAGRGWSSTASSTASIPPAGC
jgi:hypothetical protein